MKPEDLQSLSLAGVSEAIGGRKLSPVEVIEACLTRIESLNPALRSYITVLSERAMAQARQAEEDVLRGRACARRVGRASWHPGCPRKTRP